MSELRRIVGADARRLSFQKRRDQSLLTSAPTILESAVERGERARMTNHQCPIPNDQWIGQRPTSGARGRPHEFVIEALSFLGHWSLDIGHWSFVSGSSRRSRR